MTRHSFRRLPSGLVGPAAIYVGAATLNAAIPFLLLPLIARWLGPADFGVIGSFVAIVNVLVLLVGLNAYGFVSVGYFRDGSHTLPRLTGAAVTIILCASAILGAVGWAGAGVIERSMHIDRGWAWTLLAAATGQAIIAVGLAVAQTIRRPIIYGAIQVGYGVVLGMAALVLVAGAGMGWPGRALAQALAALTVAAAALLWLRTTGRITILDGNDTISQGLRFGLPLLPHSFAAVAMASMDRLALGGSYSPAVVGQYFLALQLAGAFTAFTAAVNQAWVPWLYERLSRNDAAAWTEITRVIQIGGGVLAVAVLAMALLATPLVLLVGGESYIAAVMPLRLLACYAGCQAWYTLMSAFLFYSERPRLLSMLTVSTAVIQGVLILLLLRWAAVGIAAALLISSLAAAIAISFLVRYVAVAHRLAVPQAGITK